MFFEQARHVSAAQPGSPPHGSGHAEETVTAAPGFEAGEDDTDGNVDAVNPPGVKMTWKECKASGFSKGVNGNMSGDAFDKFMNGQNKADQNKAETSDDEDGEVDYLLHRWTNVAL